MSEKKKDWTGGKASIYASLLGASNHSEEDREENDYYATDPNSLEIFLQALERDNIKLHKNIWECACGEGHLSKVLEKYGYNVKSSDLIDRGYGSKLDFLEVKEQFEGDILTNPPYKYAREFVEKLHISRQNILGIYRP